MLPRVTFGMIVLNGEPFTRYNLRALYPFAHQIIVVEGACPSASSVATEDGHSRDGTLDVLRQFKADEDPENKLIIVTAEDEGYPDGFWPEKDEMSQAYARRATGNHIWQIDVDEFYLPQDVRAVIEMLKQDPEIKAVTFHFLTFFGGLAYQVDGHYLQTIMRDVHRLFAWSPGYRYITHRPPTVVDEQERDLRSIKALTGDQMACQGIYMYHYELLFPKQVLEKCSYYAGAAWTDGLRDAETWAQECYFRLKRPFRAHMVYQFPSWLEHYPGEHPIQVVAMLSAVQEGKHPGIVMRSTDDIESLLRRPSYRLGRAWLKTQLPLKHAILKARATVLSMLRPTPVWPILKGISAKLRSKTIASVSTDYVPVTRNEVTPELTYAWQTPSMAEAQRRLVDQELRRMYQGDVIKPYRVLADAVKVTGADKGEIIEIGCGSGYYYEVLRHLLGHEIRYVGIDYSEAMIRDARKHYPSLEFQVGDAADLPLEDGACDVLVSGTVLLHVLDYSAAIAESARASREWVVFHRTPIVSGPTGYYTKSAYGVKCVEIHFGEQELLNLFGRYGLRVVAEFEISREMKTFVCQKVQPVSVGMVSE